MMLTRFGTARSSASFPIEWLLAKQAKIEDGITVLHDSYWSSRRELTRASILEALADAFPDLRKAYKDDATFVRESRCWYWANRTAVTPNDDYPFHEEMGNVPLFVEKHSPSGTGK